MTKYKTIHVQPTDSRFRVDTRRHGFKRDIKVLSEKEIKIRLGPEVELQPRQDQLGRIHGFRRRR